MKLSLRLGHLLKHRRQRGLIREINEHTGVERHAISAFLNNTASYVSLDALGRICDYLIKVVQIDPTRLPGALFALERDGFWSMLVDRQRFEFCMATRTEPTWPGRFYVTTDDAHLQGILVSGISAEKPLAPSDESSEDTPPLRHFPDPHLVPAPQLVNPQAADRKTEILGRETAHTIYTEFRKQTENSALIAIGSIKGQSLLELMLADTFSAEPFTSEDDIGSPDERACPIYFMYRESDISPASLCGGRQLSRQQEERGKDVVPGIYYETESGEWKCCPWEENAHDVAFVFYAYRPSVQELQLACGGFSSTATRLLSAHLMRVAGELWESRYKSTNLEVGLFLVQFDAVSAAGKDVLSTDVPEFSLKVIPVPAEAITRRLERKPRKKKPQPSP